MPRDPKILAFHFGALGDFVLSWPALGLLGSGPPPAELHLAARPERARLLLPPERIHGLESRQVTGLFNKDAGDDDLAWLRAFHLAAVFARSPDPVLLANLERALPRRVWPVPTQPGPGKAEHAGALQVEALRQRGLTGEASLPQARLPDNLPAPGPVLVPGSGGAAKRLPPGLAGLAARRLAGDGEPVRLVLGPAENTTYRRELMQALAGSEVEIFADQPLTKLAGLLATARPYVGADSGVSHLAAALGAPSLTVFGPTDPAIWGPTGPRARIASLAEFEAALKSGGPAWRRLLDFDRQS